MVGQTADPQVPEPRDAAMDQADDDDVQTSLVDLAALVSGSHPLSELLAHVATYAAKAIPGADGAGVTLFAGRSA